jgi:heterodisulfide reductase subunit C
MIDESAKSLLATIREKSGQDILACYHCQKCVVGCPVAEFMDVPPNAIHRLIQYGRKDEILKSATIWLCAACETCGTRCPNDIDIKGKERDVAVMHGLFMSGIRKRGRMHEVSLIRDLKLRTGGFFKDIRLGIKMFRLGKLSLSAECVKNVKDIKQMFDRAKAIE